MKQSALPGLFLFFISFLNVLTFSATAQTTYKVVCDKTDKTVKIVEADNRSPNYVPIKAGFPFRQVAQKWIDENLHTTACNPSEIIKQNNAQEKPVSPSLNKSVASQPTPPPAPENTKLQARRPGSNSAPAFKNTSFLINARFSNLGEAFNLSEKLLPGVEAGIEQLFGNRLYLGTGINMNLFTTDFNGRYGSDKELIYFFKIPAFVGFRKATNNFIVTYEIGAAANTGFTGTPLVLETYGKTANKSSFDFLTRMKVGSQKFMLVMGTDIWLTEIFENDSFKMTSVYIGLCLNF